MRTDSRIRHGTGGPPSKYVTGGYRPSYALFSRFLTRSPSDINKTRSILHPTSQHKPSSVVRRSTWFSVRIKRTTDGSPPSHILREAPPPVAYCTSCFSISCTFSSSRVPCSFHSSNQNLNLTYCTVYLFDAHAGR
jgi:hypothetical protein